VRRPRTQALYATSLLTTTNPRRQFCCRPGAIAGGVRHARCIRAVCGCLRGTKPPRRYRSTHWERRLRGLRGRRSLPGTVSDPTRGRCRDHHDAPLGRANDGEHSPELSQRAHLQSGGACPLASSVVSLAVPSRVGDRTDSYSRLWQDDAKLALTYSLFALRAPTAPPRLASRVDHAPGARPRHTDGRES